MQAENGSPAESRKIIEGLPGVRNVDRMEGKVAELLGRIAEKRMPVSTFSRLWVLGSVNSRIALGYFAFWLRGCVADAGEKERLKNEANLVAALRLFGAMGYLRGAVMKVGQMLANLPEVLPEEFAKVLGSLHFTAPRMHYALVREVFLDEFGSEPEEIFSLFDRTPFAAASLGQVHRARLHSGEEVAVKIQYPDIARTIQADLRNLRLLLQPMRLSDDWHNLLDKLAEIEQMLLMETDYEQEARFADKIRGHFAPDDRIVVPRVYEPYSTKRVLTTEYLRGRHLDEFLASDPNQETRDDFTCLIMVATMRLLYRSHLLLADPNPGNYIFMEDGRLGLIDFGCTRAMSDEEWSFQTEIERAVLNRDDAEMERLIVAACLYRSAEEMGPERLETMGRAIRWQVEPWLTEGLFDFGDRDFFRRGIDVFAEVLRKRYTRGMPVHIWGTRFILGARAIVYRLKGRCDFRKFFEQESGLQGVDAVPEGVKKTTTGGKNARSCR